MKGLLIIAMLAIPMWAQTKPACTNQYHGKTSADLDAYCKSCPENTTLCGGSKEWPSWMVVSSPPPSPTWQDYVKDGTYHAEFTDPNNQFRCSIVATAIDFDSFTVVCTKPHKVEEKKSESYRHDPPRPDDCVTQEGKKLIGVPCHP